MFYHRREGGTNIYTIEDIYALPNGQRAELIDGIMYNVAPPSRIHQKIINRLSQKLTNYMDSKNGNCEVYPSPFAVFLDADETYVDPDLSVICDKNKLDDYGCKGALDFVIEVVSPSSRKMDYSIKNGKYAAAGVREYWIVDPDKERTTVYQFEEDATPMIILFSQPIQSGIYSDLIINISELLIS